eukprot:1937850-Prymnesium_polylepis.2
MVVASQLECALHTSSAAGGARLIGRSAHVGFPTCVATVTRVTTTPLAARITSRAGHVRRLSLDGHAHRRQ